MIRYLEAEEKGRTRALWNEAFPEDSVSFGDYYYKEKTKDNRILVCEEEGRIVAMLQRNPYAVSMRGDVRTCDYIVGVATSQGPYEEPAADHAAGHAGGADALCISDACPGILVLSV